MVGVTRSLKRTLALIIGVYFIAGCTAIGVSLYFLSTPNKRRQAVIGSDQIHVSLAIGILMVLSSISFVVGLYAQKFRDNALKAFNILTLVIIFMALGLGAYAWFQTLNIQSSYKDRWHNWPESLRMLFQEEGTCCGYSSVVDYPVLRGLCTRDLLSNAMHGCEKSMYQFIITYLGRIYTALFLFTFVNFVSLMGSFVLSRALQDQNRYEKSMRKMINLHNLEQNPPMTSYVPQESSNVAYNNVHRPYSLALPQDFQRASVLYNSHHRA